MSNPLFVLTPSRIAWLETLEREGFARRPRDRSGYDCMQAGLTDWAMRVKATGEVIGLREAVRRWPPDDTRWWRDMTENAAAEGRHLEMLTDAGRAALAAARAKAEGGRAA